MSNYTLVCPFLTDDPMFACGVEFGMLYQRMANLGDWEIADFFMRQNQERILLLANRLGWQVKELNGHDKDWFWVEMEKPDQSTSPPPMP